MILAQEYVIYYFDLNAKISSGEMIIIAVIVDRE